MLSEKSKGVTGFETVNLIDEAWIDKSKLKSQKVYQSCNSFIEWGEPLQVEVKSKKGFLELKRLHW